MMIHPSVAELVNGQCCGYDVVSICVYSHRRGVGSSELVMNDAVVLKRLVFRSMSLFVLTFCNTHCVVMPLCWK